MCLNKYFNESFELAFENGWSYRKEASVMQLKEMPSTS